MLITGFFEFNFSPNMGGKSTYVRQQALICIMAQAGFFMSDSCGCQVTSRLIF